ncbi:MAG: trigger factor [Gammaproteobacteria bacterium]|uniref:Trigger factor n=1 Tax=endosymbiont of Bathymodiolus septemdierum str. Myojin knoll TaxID=1303921 RepID=A0A0P0UQL2_9GAMM|nr:trigger factor [Bathymodiolus septemdierum thioautotrophic gill symbiont]RUA05479.1 MAG: trigger factor [Gammaproteobacteria bacterium]BAS67336.1 trigger factor [endosymbiont of Bathymodiolus septemdierum str. Myojin knoll]
MKTSLETLDGLERALTVELPVDIFKQKTDAVLKKIAANTQIDGFRKGKVPMSILRKQFGAQASSEAVNDVVNDTLVDALTDAKMNPASRPDITKIDADNEKTFSYTVKFEVYPEIKINDFSKLKVEQAEAVVTADDEKKTLKGLIDQAVEYKAVKRKSKDGDQVVIDFKGMLDGEIFEGGVAADFKMVLGKGSMIAGFEEGLQGLSAGDSTKLDLTFPKEYHAPQLAGKAVVFEVDMKTVEAPTLPKLDDKFAEKFGEKSIDDLKTSMSTQMGVELATRLSNQNKDVLFTALLEANDFEVPQASIDQEAEVLLKDMQQRMQQQGMSSQSDMPASTFNPEAKRRVQLGLLVNQIATENKIEATKEQLDAKLKEMADSYGEQAQQIMDYYNADPSRMTSIESMVVEEMVQALILKEAKVTKITKTFEEVTQAQA